MLWRQRLIDERENAAVKEDPEVVLTRDHRLDWVEELLMRPTWAYEII